MEVRLNIGGALSYFGFEAARDGGRYIELVVVEEEDAIGGNTQLIDRVLECCCIRFQKTGYVRRKMGVHQVSQSHI